MNAAVTGGSGFFGGALTRALLERGDGVRVLTRSAAAAEKVRRLGAEPVPGELTQAGSFENFIRAGDVVFHAAARVDMAGRWEKFQRTTIDGTLNLLAAALPRKPKRFVYISSGGVYAMNRKLTAPIRADRTPARPCRYNFYGRAKLAAEQLVRRECERAGCEWTILRLGFLYGAGNTALLNHFVPLVESKRMYIIGAGRNRIAALYIDDAVQAALLAGEKPEGAGKIYDVAGDEPVTQKEFVRATCDALGLPTKQKRTLRGAAMFVAWITDCLSNWANHESHISRAAVALMCSDQNVDSGRIRDELGWEPKIDFAEGMRRTREWSRGLSTENRSETQTNPSMTVETPS